jgi:hypothetical protein
MNTTRKLFVSLFVIVVFAALLSACSPAQMIDLAVEAAYDGSENATGIAVNASPRVDGCDASSRQQLLNAINADVEANQNQPLSISVDKWLDNHMEAFGCIAD